MLIGMELIDEFIASVVETGVIGNSEVGPLSALLIATPESGKTSIIKDKASKQVDVLSDATGRGIIELMKAKPELSHIVLLDLVPIMSHRQSVRNTTLAVLNSMTEEGVIKNVYPGMVEHLPHGKKGLITAVTNEMLFDGRLWWNKTGFITRLVPFFYDHSPDLTLKIKDAIMSNSILAHAREVPIASTNGKPSEETRKMVDVELPEDIAIEVRNYSDRKAIEFSEKGYRRQKQFASLVRGHALYKGRLVVTDEDVDFLRRCYPFISFQRGQQIG